MFPRYQRIDEKREKWRLIKQSQDLTLREYTIFAWIRLLEFLPEKFILKISSFKRYQMHLT